MSKTSKNAPTASNTRSGSSVKREDLTGALYLSVGDKQHVFPTAVHHINETEPFASKVGPSGAPNVVAPFLAVMLDKRAPGLFTSAYGGPAAKLEWLAEMMVSKGVVANIARELMRHDLISKVNAQILRSNARFKSGTVIMSYPFLYRTLLEIVGAGKDMNDPNRVVARVLTELLARVYSEFGVMMPYKTFYSQNYYDNVVATTGDLIRAAYVATVSETLEVMRIGSAMKEREFSAAVVESVLGPNLINAANKLLAAERYNRWMRDAAILTGKFLLNSADAVLDSLRDDANLQLLSTNASWALGAAAMSVSADPASPQHEHTELLAYASLRLRELRRYETVSMERFRGMYSSIIIKTAKGAVAGAFVARNADIRSAVKAATLHEDSDIVIPMAAPMLDPYMPMLNELSNSAFGGDVARNAAYAFSTHLIGRTAETQDVHTIVRYCVTQNEMDMLGIAFATQILISSVGVQTTIYHGVRDGKVFYEGSAYYDGDYAWTTDPAEVLLLLGEDHLGSQKFTTKPQTFDENMFGGLLDVINGQLYSAATRRIAVNLPMADGSEFSTQLSLYNLVTGEDEEPILKQYVAIDRQVMEFVGSMYALGIYAYDVLSMSTSSVEVAMAEQIAIGIHDVTSRYVKPVGFSRFMKTVQTLMIKESSMSKRDARALLTNVTAKHALAVRVAGAMMVRTGLIPFGLQDDIIELLSTSNAVERAATSEAFNATLAAGLRA